MAGTIGGTGLGALAITYGYERFKDDVIWVLCSFDGNYCSNYSRNRNVYR